MSKVLRRIGPADKNNEAVASVRGITGENARPEVGAIRTQSRESRNPERGR